MGPCYHGDNETRMILLNERGALNYHEHARPRVTCHLPRDFPPALTTRCNRAGNPHDLRHVAALGCSRQLTCEHQHIVPGFVHIQ